MDAFLIAGPSKDVTVVGPGKKSAAGSVSRSRAGRRWPGGHPQSQSPEAGYYYRSDHFAFAKQGVPMLYVDGGEDLIEGGREAGQGDFG